MIKKIKIDKIPPYLGGEQNIEPAKVNFLFGLNGSGKTTISRYLNYPERPEYVDCQLEWENAELKCVVFNRDYVRDNFSESSIPGIFTLGEDNIEIKKQIETLDSEISDLNESKNKLQSLVGSDNTTGLKKDLNLLEVSYSDKFWKIKQQIDQDCSSLKLALTGVRNNKENFKVSLLQQYSDNRAELKEKNELELLCTQLFGNDIKKVDLVDIISFNELLFFETNEILQRVIVGKEDVDIAGLIKKLGNDIWFRQGIQYLDSSEGRCPFCQQPLKADFSDKVVEYFDETYDLAVQTINALYDDYSRHSETVLEQLEILIDSPSNFLNKNELLSTLHQLQYKIEMNINKIAYKKEYPNAVVQLDTLKEEAESVRRVINEANTAITEHNNRIIHIEDERRNLKLQVWRFILDSLSTEIDTYMSKKEEISNLISQSCTEIEEIKNIIDEKCSELRSLEQRQTSIIPTANGINTLLKNYGFTGFYLEVNDDQNSYQFIRENGSPAYDSLSEGERNFVTFLYFMYSLKGNTDESGHNDNKVVVIDDPVSSLDNDVLFLVSALLRDLFADIYADKGTIKQIFILSHNLYFFKEVSFEKGIKKRETRYWMIVKANNVSSIISYEKNPISSTYEMLWDEIRNASFNPTSYNVATLANTMRRIIEHYFKFLGGMDLNKFHLEFPEGERQIFKSLISWANSGSHSEFDDFSATPNIYDAEKHLKVFRDLFDKTGHIAHYDMMMKNVTEDLENG